jgi:hypothetical protein
MDASLIHLSLGYYLAFGPFIQELRLKINFLKHIDPLKIQCNKNYKPRIFYYILFLPISMKFKQ